MKSFREVEEVRIVWGEERRGGCKNDKESENREPKQNGNPATHLAEPDAWIKPRICEIRDEVRRDVNHGDEKDAPLDEGIIPRKNCLNGETSYSGPRRFFKNTRALKSRRKQTLRSRLRVRLVLQVLPLIGMGDTQMCTQRRIESLG